MTKATLQDAVTLHQKGQLAEAVAVYQDILRREPDHSDALHLLGIASLQTGGAEKAAAFLEKAIGVNPGRAETHFYLGVALNRLQKSDAAIASYDQALRLNPDYAEAYNSRANIVSAAERPREALDDYGKAIGLNPTYIDAYYNRGIVLRYLKERERALADFEQIARLKVDFAEAHYHRGAIFMELSNFKAASAAFELAITCRPDYAEAYADRGNALGFLARYDAAIASYDKAIAIKPNLAPAHSNRARILADINQYPAAVASYDKALHLQPDMAFARGARLHAKLFMCDWSNLAEEIKDLEDHVARGEMAASPFSFLLVNDSPALQRTCAAKATQTLHPANDELGSLAPHPRGAKIRIGYYSADYHNHAVMALMTGVFERHDKTAFELTAFSYDSSAPDDMRARVAAAFDSFIDVRNNSDREVTALSRELQIDIAIDLSGYTRDNRTGIFARRAAPIQVNYLGYPGTVGADYIDYLIADARIIPETARAHYAEKIATLPFCYQPNDNTRDAGHRILARAELGLPESGFVFCCFNNNFKVLPAVFAGWMRILQQVPGSVLWLLEHSPLSADNLRREAARRGIDEKRLIFAARVPTAEHLARHHAADLFLDTFPYTAHTTASDALWMGLPVLTRIGESFPARVAASLLTAMDVAELITTTTDTYENLAVALASDRAHLEAIRQKIVRSRLTAPLFDTALFTRHLEAAYTRMVERLRAGLAPDHFAVAP